MDALIPDKFKISPIIKLIDEFLSNRDRMMLSFLEPSSFRHVSVEELKKAEKETQNFYDEDDDVYDVYEDVYEDEDFYKNDEFYKDDEFYE